MKAKLIINSKELEVEISEEELKKFEKKSKKTGYERVELREKYYFIDEGGNICSRYKGNVHDDDMLHVVDNCYSSPDVAENNARADKLMRQLRRFSVENRKHVLEWGYSEEDKHYIFYNHEINEIFVENNQFFHTYGTIYFDSYTTAQRAIDTFYDELVWYFTEYKDSL